MEDGQLIDVSEWAKETGFRFPVAVTVGVWAYVQPPDGQAGQDVRGRAHDVLWMLLVAIKKANEQADLITYQVIFQQSPNTKETVDLWSLCGPGDAGEPVITIMLPEEY